MYHDFRAGGIGHGIVVTALQHLCNAARLDLGALPRQGNAMAPRTPWHNRNFRLLFAASAGTNLADGLMAVALPWLATRLTDDPFLVGLVAAGRTLPWFILALPAGVMTDRLDHRRILLAADALRLVLMLALVLLALMAAPGTGPVLALAALSFVLGSAEVIRDNTAQTFLPTVIAKPELERANGALWATEQLGGQLLGPPLAGVMIGLAMAIPFGVQTGLFLVALGLVGAIHLPRQIRSAPPLPPVAALKEGAVWLWRELPLRRLALILGGFNFLGYGAWSMMVLYGQNVLGLGAFGYGALLSAAALGGLAATVLGPRILDRISPTRAILFGMAVFTANSAVFAMGAPVWVIAPAMVIDGFAGMLWNIAQVSYRQRHIPTEILGRVNSAFRFLGTGPAAFGAIAFGWLVSLGDGPDAVLLPYAVAAALGAALTAYALTRLRLP